MAAARICSSDSQASVSLPHRNWLLLNLEFYIRKGLKTSFPKKALGLGEWSYSTITNIFLYFCHPWFLRCFSTRPATKEEMSADGKEGKSNTLTSVPWKGWDLFSCGHPSFLGSAPSWWTIKWVHLAWKSPIKIDGETHGFPIDKVWWYSISGSFCRRVILNQIRSWIFLDWWKFVSGIQLLSWTFLSLSQA